MIQKVLGFLEDRERISRIADLGCGTGGQTLLLARHLPGTITGLDLIPDFIDVLCRNVKKSGLEDRVHGIVGSMEELPFEKHSLDLIWSEGAIDNIGFEKGLSHWREFLKKGGYVAVSCPSWLTGERPAAVERFWSDAGSRLDPIGTNLEIMCNCGYQFIAAFALPEQCWTENYLIPREAAVGRLMEKYAGDETVAAYAAENRYEAELYAKYHSHYGYVFYIGRVI